MAVLTPMRVNAWRSEVRDLIVTENITLDGVIEATEGWFAPIT